MDVRERKRPAQLALALLITQALLWGASCATTTTLDTPENEEEATELDLVYAPTVTGGYRRFDRFLPDDEAGQLIESFDWNDTDALPESGTDGVPTLYYVVAQVNGIEQTDLLERAAVAWSILPFFESEQPELPANEAIVLASSGAHGSFVFALMSGAAYNVARESALAGRPLFDIVALRQPPPEVLTHSDGSLDLEALAAMGFEWPAPYVAESDEELGLSSQRVSEALTDFSELFVSAAYESYLAGANFISLVINLVVPTTVIRGSLTISSPDADWAPALSPLLRTWGNTGRITMPGQRVFALRTNGVGLYRSTTSGALMTAAFRVPTDATYRVCYENRIGTLRVLDFALPTTTCTGVITVPAGSTGVGFSTTLAAEDLQTVAVGVDALQYLQQFQISIRPPVIAGGQLAVAMTGGQNGFVFGHGGRDPATLLLINSTDAIVTLAATGVDGLVQGVVVPGNLILSRFGLPPVIPGAPPIGPGILPIKSMYNVDIVWPMGNPSRLVIAHEIGHHMFMQLLVNAELNGRVPPGSYAAAMLQIIFGSVFPRNRQQNPFFEAVAVNEGVADFFASQLAGGGNRLSPVTNGTYPGDTVGVGPGGAGVGEVYCDPTPTPFGLNCFEFNFTGNEGLDPLNDEASRVSTLLVDLIDDFPAPPFGGVRQHVGIVWPPSTTCTNGQLICPGPTPLALPGPSAGAAEEAVNVSAGVVLSSIGTWLQEGPVANTTGFMRGITRGLRGALVPTPDAASCTVYALHSPGAICPPAWLP